MKKLAKYKLKELDSPHFTTTPIELRDYVPYEAKRVYFMTYPKSGISKTHCHYVEDEFFVVLQGSATLIYDCGNGIQTTRLGRDGNKNDAAYVPHYVWHGWKDVSHDAVIMAISSTNYKADRSDYLEDYKKYLEIRDHML